VVSVLLPESISQANYCLPILSGLLDLLASQHCPLFIPFFAFMAWEILFLVSFSSSLKSQEKVLFYYYFFHCEFSFICSHLF
jgi:hypothetical protein